MTSPELVLLKRINFWPEKRKIFLEKNNMPEEAKPIVKVYTPDEYGKLPQVVCQNGHVVPFSGHPDSLEAKVKITYGFENKNPEKSEPESEK